MCSCSPFHSPYLYSSQFNLSFIFWELEEIRGKMVINVYLSFWPNNIVSDVTDHKPESNIECQVTKPLLIKDHFPQSSQGFWRFLQVGLSIWWCLFWRMLAFTSRPFVITTNMMKYTKPNFLQVDDSQQFYLPSVDTKL